MKRIELTHGKSVIVDGADYHWAMQYKWIAFSAPGGHWYAVRYEWKDGSTRMIFMHRELMGAVSGQQIDHINRNGLDNRRRNLRFCTTAQNQWNAKKRCDNKSGYIGVHRNLEGRWVAQIRVNGEKKYLGCFRDAKEAALAYNEAAHRYHGEFASVNVFE